MGTKYSYRCPNQSYAISLEMCLARQLRGDRHCRRCRGHPVEAEAADASGGPSAAAGTSGRVAA